MAQQGGISSYGLVLLLVAFFQELEYHGDFADFGTENCGTLFRLFFDFYATKKFQYYDIRPFLPMFPISHSPFLVKPHLNPALVVVDPLNAMNNVTRSTFNVDRLESMFVFLYFWIHQKADYGVLRQVFEVAKTLTALSAHP